MKKITIILLCALMVFVAVSCDDTEAAHEHSFGAEWKSDVTNHWHECDCGEKSDLAAHTWDEGKVKQASTGEEDDVMEYTCSVCKKTRNEKITAIKSLEELKNAAKADGKYYLATDITITEALNIEKPITIDGNGKTVKVTYSSVDNQNTGFVIASTGVTIKNVKFESANTGRRDSAMITIVANGTADKPVVIDSCLFDSKKELSTTIGESAIIAHYTGGGYLTVKNCTIKNVKYGMYFNHISNATVSNNTIDGTLYNGIIVAADSEEYKCQKVVIGKNTLTNISFANYANEIYSSGIVVGAKSSDIEVKEDNSITMLNGKKAILRVSAT